MRALMIRSGIDPDDYQGDPTELTVGQLQEMIDCGVLEGTVWSGDHNGPIPEE
jgi:hypothetical protein